MKQYLQRRLDIIDEVGRSSDVTFEYCDVVVIACNVLSACAARRWPGEGFDHKRFVELLTQRSPESFRTTWISLPSLLNSGKIAKAQTPYGEPGHDTNVLTDDDDLGLPEALSRFPNLLEFDLKKHSFASLIYERVRCGYSHEMLLGENTNHVPASSRACRVSYIGRSVKTPSGSEHTVRMVHFHMEYLLDLARYHVANLPSQAEQKPATWWYQR